jgi:hypothetical protein
VRPTVAGLAMHWNVVAAPGYRFGFNAGPSLQSGVLQVDQLGVTATYGNPFVPAHDWNPLFTLATLETRTYTPPAGLPVTLFAGMDEILDLSPGVAPAPGFPLSLEAGLPVTISLDGKLLLTDGALTITKPTRLVEVTFVTDRPTATLFSLQVFDLLPNAAGKALEFHQVLAAASSEAKFEIPPAILEAGHTYTLRVVCTAGGFPAILDGDLQTRQLPASEAFLDSAVFTVTP